MQQISAQTRLSEVLDLDPQVVDYIVSLKADLFQRLYHPSMRRLMAKRVTVGRVAAMAQVPVAEVLTQIATLANVTVAADSPMEALPLSPLQRPAWLVAVPDHATIRVLDVRSLHTDLMIDLLPIVLRTVKALAPSEVFRLVHVAEPQPLYDIWHTMGQIEWFAEPISAHEWWIWVRRMPSPQLERHREGGLL
jgi:hypothetical protein